MPPVSLPFRIIAVVVAGASMKLISPPIGWHHLHWFNMVLAFWALYPDNNKRNAWLMYLFGFALILFNYDWIREPAISIARLPAALAWGTVFLYAAAFALPFALLGASTHWLRDRIGLAWIWMLPGLQVAIEQIWPALFPYYHGALFYRSGAPWQLASVLGVTGLSYLVFLTTTGLSELIYQRRKPLPKSPKFHLIAIAVLMLITFAFGIYRHGKIESELQQSPSIKVAVLQQNVTMQYRLKRNAWQTIDDWGKLTQQVLDKKPDLVIWPEGAQGGPFNPTEKRHCSTYPYKRSQACRVLQDKSLYQYYSDLAKDNNFAFLVGGGTVEPYIGTPGLKLKDIKAYNSCYLFDQQGEITGRYDKMILLPFGEYVPGSSIFPVLKNSIPGAGNFLAGEKVTYFKTQFGEKSYSFSTPICYEAILNSQMRKMANADLFINITNDAWFGDTAAPHQHAMLAAVQSIEWGRPMIRMAYTGVSFIVEPHGDIPYETKPFVELAEVTEVRLHKVSTIYRLGGWIFPWIWTIIWPIFWFYLRRKKPKNT